MNIALAQTNPVIGDFSYNLNLITSRILEARKQGCRLIIFPELSLCGYPPQDLLERPAFLAAHDRALNSLISQIRGIGVIVGALEHRHGSGKSLYNSALLIDEGKVLFRARKQLLPTYDVFDETRYFEPGDLSMAVPFAGLTIGLSVCEDIWHQGDQYPVNPVAELVGRTSRLDFLVNISASPYYHGKLGERQAVFARLCRQHAVPLLYVNQVGGQDSLIFDGHSMVMDSRGEILQVAAGFREDILLVDSENWGDTGGRTELTDTPDKVFAALTLGVRDYLHKSGFKSAILGLSGGIDSALTAVIACRALGAENVHCVALPSPYTAKMSVDDAALLADNLGCHFSVMPIQEVMEAYRRVLEPAFAGRGEDVTEQNIQARIRGNLLMALSNKFGHLLLSTGNKSEMAVGYCTLYGDMSGGLAVLADVPKMMVYELARWINRQQEIIPERILNRPPSAELKPDQTDQDDLPPYEILDPILTAYLEDHLGVEEIVAKGFKRKVVRDVVSRIKRNEYKRKQAPLGLKVTSKAFGHGRRYPVVQGFSE